MLPEPDPAHSRTAIRLPNTCVQNRHHNTHIRLLTSVRSDTWNGAGFEGRLFHCGARVEPAALGERPVLLECAGPQGSWRNGQKREYLWILWRYDWEARDWREIARAMAFDWKWALVLRGPAIDALRPAAASVPDTIRRGREVTEELLQGIDAALVTELPEVRALVLTSIYDGMAGRIVAC